jgi:hypothetical protein
VFVVNGGGFLNTELRFFVSVFWVEDGVEVRRESRDRLWARVRERRSVARMEAVTSAEGGSPKMKNFMKAPRRRTMESWPRRRPWVKESLWAKCQPCVIGVKRGTNEDSALMRDGASEVAIVDAPTGFSGDLEKDEGRE